MRVDRLFLSAPGLLALALVCGACGDDDGAADAAGQDSGGADGGADATSPVDAGDSSDTGASDAGPAPDVFDAGTDAGPPNPLGEDWCADQGEDFSFFVTSLDALWVLSGSDPDDLDGGGFGGNFGGLSGADEICQTIGDATGHGDRDWRAFLSATDGGDGNAAHAIERIGAGPWTDANGRLVATGIDGLLSDFRPDGDEASTSDLPDECGVPLSSVRGMPDTNGHDVVTGSNTMGRLNSTELESTCNDWTSDDGEVGSNGGGGGGGPLSVMCGHSYPRRPDMDRGAHWMSDHAVRGCGRGANLIQNGAGEGTCIGCSGGYGAIYCFAAD